MVETLDREAILDYFSKRSEALSRGDKAMAAYWAGRIDGHCLQNAISDAELRVIAEDEGWLIGWDTAMGAA